ncbi:MAG: YebC/PmpR family DNA-binding transcriptional regulator [bacterium]|nr:YebC/PmpR family DNA-binding transcriptional regulator [bacterium]
MSGHSKWHSIKHQKAVTDARRGKLFTKLANEIALSAKDGSDPGMNFRLRLAIQKAKQANMPSVNIDRSIARGSGSGDGSSLEELNYEGYGPMGVAIMVKALSDNRNRTASEIRSIFSKYGGNLSGSGSVAYLFEQKGMITLKPRLSKDEMSLKAIEAGASDIDDSSDQLIIYTELNELEKVKSVLGKDKIESAELDMKPTQTIKITDSLKANSLLKLINSLEDNDDVVNVYANFDIDDNILKELA